MGDLTSLSNVRAWLPGVSDGSDDALLSLLISRVSAFIQTWLNRTFDSQTYTEVRDGHGGARLMFSNYPVTAVSSVSVDGVDIPAAASITGPGYRFNDTSLMLNGYAFRRGMGNVVLSYTAGFAEVPLEIAQACMEVVVLRYKERDRIGVSSKSIGGENVSFSLQDFTESARTTLKNYKKVISL